MKLPASTVSLLPMLGIAAMSLAAGYGIGRLAVPADSGPREANPPSINEKREIRTLRALASNPFPSADTSAVASRRPARDDLRRIMGNPDARKRSSELDALLAGTDESGVKQILDWVAAMSDGAAKRVALGKVMQKWGELDGAAAAAYGVDNFQQTGNTAQLRSALLGWAQNDPSSSMQYLQGLGLGNGLMNNLSRDVLGIWSDFNPQAAASYLKGNPGILGGGLSWGGGLYGGTASVVAANWAAQDPQAAMNWVTTSLSGRQQLYAANQVIQNWAGQDLNGATAYVNSLPGGQTRDLMVSGMAQQIAMDNPASAMQWAGTLTNAAMQERTVFGVLGQSGVFGPSGTDITAVQTLLQNSTLSPMVQSNIISRLSNFGQGGRRQGGAPAQ